MNVDVFLICFSVSSRESFQHVKDHWVSEAKQYSQSTPFIIVGLQSDLRDIQAPLSPDSSQPRLPSPNTNTNNNNNTSSISAQTTRTQVGKEEGEMLAKQMRAHSYCECSARTGKGVETLLARAAAATLPEQKQCTILWGISRRRNEMCTLISYALLSHHQIGREMHKNKTIN